MRDGVLCEDGEAVGGDELRDTVVDLRVDMVGTAREHDAAVPALLHPKKSLLSLSLCVLTGL